MINKSKMVGITLMTTVITCMLLASSASAGYAKLATYKFDLTGASSLLTESPGPSFFMWYNESGDDRMANVTNSGSGLMVTDPLDVTGHYRYDFNPTPGPEHTNWSDSDYPGWIVLFNYTAVRADTDGVVRLHLVLHDLLGDDNEYFSTGVGYMVGFANGSGPGAIADIYNMDLNYTLTDNNITADISLSHAIGDALANMSDSDAYLAIIVFGHGGNQTGTGIGQLDMRGSGLYIGTGGGGGSGTGTTSTASTTSIFGDMNVLLGVIAFAIVAVFLVVIFSSQGKKGTTAKRNVTPKTVNYTRTPKRRKKGAVSMWPKKHKKVKRNMKW